MEQSLCEGKLQGGGTKQCFSVLVKREANTFKKEEEEGETKTKTQWKGEVVNKCLCLPSTSGSLSSYPVITSQVAIVHFKALWCPWKLSLVL